MISYEDVPISRGKNTFFQRGDRGHFVASDNTISINWSSGGPDGYREYKLVAAEVDTLFVAYRSFKARNEGENFWLISWRISQTSVAICSEGKPVPFVFPSVEMERLIVQAIADFLWMTDHLNLAGNFQVEQVTLAGGIANRLGWGRYGLH
jgi:hypothetical protein